MLSPYYILKIDQCNHQLDVRLGTCNDVTLVSRQLRKYAFEKIVILSKRDLPTSFSQNENIKDVIYNLEIVMVNET